MSDRRMALMGLAAGAVGLSVAVIAGRVWDGARPLRSVDGAAIRVGTRAVASLTGDRPPVAFRTCGSSISTGERSCSMTTW